jgi:Putative Ig domain/Galactose oxidase, central domain
VRLRVHILPATFGLMFVGALLSSSPAHAQVASQNVNMVSGTQWPTGDPFLQRQNEPSMAVSTRNPMHILSGANDYRTVDLETVLSGGGETGDAWLGLFKSFDGGLTWQSNLLPGCPYAVSQCMDSRVLQGGYQAAADPVVRAGTNGMFYYAGLAFDRATSATTASSVSSIFIARYNDLNNNEQLDPIAYIDTHIVASGNSSQFLDKPAMAVDIPRLGADTCSFDANEPGAGPNGSTLSVHQSFPGGNVYLAYTDFLAGTKANSTPTHLMFTHSSDCGVTWSKPVQINSGTTTSQGSSIAINPLNGNVYVAWRQFASSGVPDAIMVAQSSNQGKSFSKPVQISRFQPFDQGTTGTSFRTNAYPSITTDFFGFVYVAFSARGLTSSGDARVVVAGSLDGSHWTLPIMVDNRRQDPQTNPSGRGHQIMPAITFANGRLTLLYYDLRLDHYADFYTPDPASLGDYDSMLEPQGELAPPNPNPASVFTPYIDDAGLTLRRHTLDLRVLELGIFPTVTLGPSVLVSQYEYGCCVNPGLPDIEQFKFNVPNLPLFDQGQEAFLGDYIDIVPSPMFVPLGRFWIYNFKPSVNPLFHATWTDNRDVVPPANGDWENYTAPVVAGALSVENGNPLPACVPGQEGMRNQNIYTAQITNGLVVGAPGNAKPLGTTTFNGQTVPFQRAFPVEAENLTNQPINVRYSIANQPTGGSASFLQFSVLTSLDVTIPPYSSVSRSVFVTSSDPQASITVNVDQISAIGGAVVNNGLSSSAVLNPDITNPNITNPNITNPNITNPDITNAEVTNPNITNPNITNPNITNPNITNPNITNTSYLNPNITNPNITNLDVTNVSATNPNITNPNITNPNITNPNITNPNITNPDITNGSIQDVTYPITNNGNTTASYTVKTASTATPPDGIVLQLLINKLYQTPVASNCKLGVQTHWITVANITNPKLFSVADPNITNPDITNSAPNEATVTLAPGETAYITIRVVNPTPAQTPFNPLSVIIPVTVPQAVNTTTVLSNPGNPNLTAPPVYPPLSILTTALPATDQNVQGYSFQLQSSGGKPGTDTWSLVSSTVQGVAVSSPGLLTAPALPLGPNSVTVQVADSATPANLASMTYSIPVNNAFLENTIGIINDGVVGQPYVAFPFTTTGGTSPIVWTATGLPPGLFINSSTGQVSGTPTTANVTGYAALITATDSALPQSVLTLPINIRVASPIAIVQTTLPSGTIGVAYSTQLTAAGGIGGYVFGLPAPATGVSLDGTGLLTIANPQSSSVSFSVSVHDQANPNQFATANYTITFAGAPTVNIIYVTQPPNYVQGQPNPNSPVHIHVQDNQGAAIAGVSVTMSFNGTPPCATAVLSDNADTLTQTTNATGDVFFTFMTISRGGVGYSLTATVSSISAVSNAFNVAGYCEAGNMNTARRNHVMLTLPNGKVLITGGAANANATGALASAELYDPAAHTFTTIGPMNVARIDHTMTLLNNGKVLIAGGFNDQATLASAEIFDPSNNSFTLTGGSMTSPRAQHAATLLPNGTVLITGGNFTDTLSSAEIFDPNANGGTGGFTATANPMNSVRQLHHADLLPNGLVLVSGGLDNFNNALASTELYDPAAGTFTLSGNMNTARGNHGTALLSNGQLLVQGGLTGPGNSLVLTSTAELYNPATGTFATTTSMSQPRGQYYDKILADGTVFVTGGAPLPNGANSDIYDPATLVFAATGNYTAVQTGLRPALLPDGTVLLASGVDSTPVTVPNSEIYYPLPVANGITVTSPSTLPTAVVNTPYATVLLQKGGVGIVTWHGLGIPTGLTLNSNGVLTGTPLNTGTYDVTFTVTDTNTPPQSLTTTLSLTINPPLAITTTTLPNAATGSGSPAIPYSAQIQTSGGAGGALTFSVVAGALPPSITLDTATGLLSSSSVVDSTGTYSFTIQAVSAGPPSSTATEAFTLTLVPFFTGTTPNTLPNATESVPYAQNITATGGVPPFDFQILVGSVPPGISLNTLGPTLAQLNGIPTSSGIFHFTVQGSDSSSPAQIYYEDLTLTVLPQPPTALTVGPGGPSQAILQWATSISVDVVGYRVYRGTSSGSYNTIIDAGSGTLYTDTPGTGTWYYVVTAVGASGVESSRSNEVVITVP